MVGAAIATRWIENTTVDATRVALTVVLVSLALLAVGCGSTGEPPTGDTPTEAGREEPGERDASGEQEPGEVDVQPGENGSAETPSDTGPAYRWDGDARRLTIGDRIAVQFAAAPSSRLDLLPGQARAVDFNTEEADTVLDADTALRHTIDATATAVSYRIRSAADHAAWLHERLGGAPTLATQYEIVETTLGGAAPTSDGGTVRISADQFAQPAEIVSAILAPAYPAVKPHVLAALARLGLQEFGAGPIGLAASRWSWATQAAAIPLDPADPDGTLPAEQARQQVISLREVITGEGPIVGLDRLQMMDGLMFRLDQVGIRQGLAEIAQITADPATNGSAWQDWQQAWITSRLPEGLPGESGPRLVTLRREQQQGVAAAVRALPNLVTGNLTSARPAELDPELGRFGRIAVLAGEWRFGRIMLTEGAIRRSYLAVAANRWQVPEPVSILPLQPPAYWGAIAAAMDAETDVPRTLRALRDAGARVEASLFTIARTIRFRPGDRQALDALSAWATTAYGDSDLVPLIRLAAFEETDAADTPAGQAYEAELPTAIREIAAARRARE